MFVCDVTIYYKNVIFLLGKLTVMIIQIFTYILKTVRVWNSCTKYINITLLPNSLRFYSYQQFCTQLGYCFNNVDLSFYSDIPKLYEYIVQWKPTNKSKHCPLNLVWLKKKTWFTAHIKESLCHLFVVSLKGH